MNDFAGLRGYRPPSCGTSGPGFLGWVMSDVQIVVRFNYAYGRYGAGDVAGFYEAQAERLLAMVNRRGEPLCQKLKVIKKAKMPGTPGGEPPTDLMNRRRKITSAGKSGSKMKRE